MSRHRRACWSTGFLSTARGRWCPWRSVRCGIVERASEAGPQSHPYQWMGARRPWRSFAPSPQKSFCPRLTFVASAGSVLTASGGARDTARCGCLLQHARGPTDDARPKFCAPYGGSIRHRGPVRGCSRSLRGSSLPAYAIGVPHSRRTMSPSPTSSSRLRSLGRSSPELGSAPCSSFASSCR